MDVRKKQMNYNEDNKKMGEAYAQVQEKMRQENADRAEAMLKFEAEKISCYASRCARSNKSWKFG